MSSDDAPASGPEPEVTPEQYRQRALLLADLGRYDEAADEIAAGLAAASADPALLNTLARLHLAAEQPVEALTAAERASAAAPDAAEPLVLRAMALVDDRRFGEAARLGAEVLLRWPHDAYAQRAGAAVLSESRNGQDALNAAWTAVKLSPRDADAHLVLAVVSARLRLFDLAQRAYAEALELDAALGEAQHDVGVVRLERRRWAAALEQLADAASLATPPDATPPSDATSPFRAAPVADGPSPTTGGADLPVSRPTGPVLDPFTHSADEVRRTVLVGAAGIMVTALLTAVMAVAGPGVSRAWAGMMGLVVPVVLLIWLRRQLTEPVAAALRRIRGRDRRLAFAGYVTLAAPLLFLGYAAVGGPAPLVAVLVVTAAAELAVLTRR